MLVAQSLGGGTCAGFTVRNPRRVAGLAGERLVWGSDWPHTAFAPDSMPAYASVWEPVVNALGAVRADRVRMAGAALYR